MPNNVAVDSMNAALSTESVRAVGADDELMQQLQRPGSFLDVAQSLLGLDDAGLEYLRAIPSVLQEAMRAAVAAAVADGKAVQMQYSPAYDFEVRLWDYGAAVSLHLSGPYPPEFARDRYLSSQG